MHKIVNGIKVAVEGDAELNQHAHEKRPAYRLQRIFEYPAIGNQLDAILKYLEQDKKKLPQELRAVIKQWRDVKDRYPKESK